MTENAQNSSENKNFQTIDDASIINVEAMEAFNLGEELAELKELFGEDLDSSIANRTTLELDIDAILKEAEQLNIDTFLAESDSYDLFDAVLNTPQAAPVPEEPVAQKSSIPQETPASPFSILEKEAKEKKEEIVKEEVNAEIAKAPEESTQDKAAEAPVAEEEKPVEIVQEVPPVPVEYAESEDLANNIGHMSPYISISRIESGESLEDQIDDDELISKEHPIIINESNDGDDGDPYFADELADPEVLARQQAKKKEKIRFLSTLLLSIVFIAVINVGLYKHFSEKYSVEESDVSRILSEMAMVIKSSQNTDNDILKSGPIAIDTIQDNLKYIETSSYQLLSEFSNLKDFTSPGYEIFVKFSNQFDRFVLVAQPNSSLMASILSKPALFVDGQNMELFSFSKNLVALDALKLRDQILTDEQVISLEDLKKKSEQVPLLQLNKTIEYGFAAPIDLEIVADKAGYKIYNAPRFFLFTNQVVSKLAALGRGEIYKRDIEELDEKLKVLANFDQLVLYASQGAPMALNAYKGLKKYFPQYKFYIGYLEINATNGRVRSARLVPQNDLMQAEASITKDDSIVPVDLGLKEGIKRENFFYKELSSLIQSKEAKLQKITDEINALASRFVSSTEFKSNESYKELEENYSVSNRQADVEISTKIQELYDSSPELNDQKILFRVIDQLHINYLVPTAIKKTDSGMVNQISDQLSAEKVTELLADFHQISDWELLKKTCDTIYQILNSGNINASDEFYFRKNFKEQLLTKLESLILTPIQEGSAHDIQKIDKSSIQNLLHMADVDSQEEQNFYLEEFDKLYEYLQTLPSKESLEKFENISQSLNESVESEVNLTAEQKFFAKDYYAKSLSMIQEKKERLAKIEQIIHEIPLNYIGTLDENSKRQQDSRIAQQIIVAQNSMPTSTDKDAQLKKAIDILYLGTEFNRSLWNDIIVARIQLLATPQQDIEKWARSGLGLTINEESAINEAKNKLTTYINAKKSVSLLRPESNQYPTQYYTFKIENLYTLESIQSKCGQILEHCEYLIAAFETYIYRIQEILSDYEIAKEEGFFMNNSVENNLKLSRIRQRLRGAFRLEKELKSEINNLSETAKNYLKIVESEFQFLQNGLLVTPATVSDLQQQMNSIPTPNLSKNNFIEKIHKLFEIPLT